MKKQVLISCIAAVVCFSIGFGSMALIKGGSKAPNASGDNQKEDVVLEVLNQTEGVVVTARCFYPDYAVLSEKMMQIRYGLENGLLDDKALVSELEAAKRELEQLGYHYDYAGKTSITADDGTVYGAMDRDGYPIAGGDDFYEIFGSAFYDYHVGTDDEFYQAVLNAKAGDMIYISKNAVIDLSDLQITNFPDLKIPEGITIMSGRGDEGSAGGTLKLSLDLAKMFSVASNVRFCGLVLEGPDATTHDGVDHYAVSNGVELTGNGIVIENCEIAGFSGAGITVSAGDAVIRNCYIHHIRGNNEGNAINVTGGKATIEGNLFSHCRNAVSVAEGASAEIINNVEVGTSLGAVVRVTGSAESVVIKNNTVLGYTQPIVLDAAPKMYVVENNIFSLNDAQYDEAGLYGAPEIRDAVKTGAVVKNNVFNIKEPYLVTWYDASSADAVS